METRNNDILVSVCMVTYNHEEFIEEAINSIVSQKTNFKFELIIGEDCSNDSTRDICTKYKDKYPDIIQLNFNNPNIGAQQNILKVIAKAQGKYIALCEGDDYWIDSHKLQKQVGFMESNAGYNMIAHAAKITHDNESFTEIVLDKESFNLEDILLNDWGIMTASIVFRKEDFKIPSWFANVKNGDFALQVLLAESGKIAYLKDIMSVYRQHPAGISAKLNPLNQAAWLSHLLYLYNKHSKKLHLKLIKQRIGMMYKKQIGFAKDYHLRKQNYILRIFDKIKLIAPFAIRHLRQ